MLFRVLPVLLSSLMLVCSAFAQEPNAASHWPSSNGSGANPQRGERGMGSGMDMGIAGGRGVMGTVTSLSPDHFMVKTEDGQTFTVHFSVNTRIMKEPPGSRGPGPMRRGDGQRREPGQGQNQAQRERRRPGRFGADGTPPETIKATDIKIGDAIAAMGEMDEAAKSIGAVGIVLLDPETANEMTEMRANYGKTWLQGKVTAIDGVKVTLMGPVDNAAHSFVADENTTFRKRREPITLADIEVGDMVRANGAVKDGVFTAANVVVMGRPPAGISAGPNPPSSQ